MSSHPSRAWRSTSIGFTNIAFLVIGALFFLQQHRTDDPGLLIDPEFSAEATNNTLTRRDDYSCSKSNPCRNGACCGASGYCGYGPTYCGNGCLSQCSATAECGKYAKVAGTKCPLNTCCSEFGFCGTTKDFCTGKCQSNCVLNPKPPAGSSAERVQNRVIGYYEAWSARKSCHKVAPSDLPLDALTHVNFAFAYIKPGSYEIVTMDGQTPSSLFKDTANLKSIKPDLKVAISVGGWTFSDNGTETQPLFGEIAADADKRQKFADNAVHFMKQYGFDGLDIDWEYPGAPDRGGRKEDVNNFVLLMQTLRRTFAASGGHFELTFTAPSSYWYLRWFDLPSLVKHVDWINLMSYDLHGSWDSDNPIGSIVQGHTNLTEIKLATELFWRVKIPPSKLVMGFGFYGRSFTLRDPKCTKPGCPFKSASRAGPCTDTAGILGYYEIQMILKGSSSSKRDTAMTATYDKVAAVKYFTFDKDQWISYDDAATMKQKTDWANDIGLGGALIWASDLDDSTYTAHSGLVGRSIVSNPTLQTVDKALSDPQSVIQNLAGSNGQKCFKATDKCRNLNDNKEMAEGCGEGFTVVGWDDAGCGTSSCHCGKPICCPTNEAPKDCIWRGDDNGSGVGSDCSAQCRPGEVNIKGIRSSWGGGFVNDGNTNKCGRGNKAFCCPNPDAGQITRGCKYAPCGEDCPGGTTSLFKKAGSSGCWYGAQQYCCPDPVQLKDCRWESGGSGLDCANAVCSETELEIDRSPYGSSITFDSIDNEPNGCGWGRQMAACCTVQKATPKPSTCSTDLCRIGLCTGEQSPARVSVRDLTLFDNATVSLRDLLERDKDRTFNAMLPDGIVLVIIAALYPSLQQLYQQENSPSQALRRFYRLIAGWCIGPAVSESTVPKGSNPQGLNGGEADHPIDIQIAARFVEACASGLLRNSRPVPGLPGVGAAFFHNYWDHPLHDLANAPAIGGPNGAKPSTFQDRLMGAFGSYDYPGAFVPVDRQLNGPKGQLMNLNAPVSLSVIRRAAEDAVGLDTTQAADALLTEVRLVFALFEYMNEGGFVQRFNDVHAQVRTQLGLVERATGQPNLQRWWDVFTDDYFDQIQSWGRSFAADAIAEAARVYVAAAGNRNLQTYASVINTLSQWESEIDTRIRMPPITGSMPLPQPPSAPTQT